LTVVAQHLWLPLPISQLPAIFLQQSLSAGVINEFGRQANDGVAANSQARKNPIAERKLTFLSYIGQSAFAKVLISLAGNLLFAVASLRLAASEPYLPPACCERESEGLSQRQMKALVKKTEPIQAPCCPDRLHISGTVVLAITVDPTGNVTCVR
jgi:hypothetical protein